MIPPDLDLESLDDALSELTSASPEAELGNAVSDMAADAATGAAANTTTGAATGTVPDADSSAAPDASGPDADSDTDAGSDTDADSASEADQDFMDEVPDDVEMSIFDHLEELRLRIFYALIAIVLAIILCFVFVNPIVRLLQVPAQGIKFLQLAPGEYFFVSLKVAGYSGLVAASPFVLYQIVQFVLPGLTRRERRLLAPVVLGSTVLFVVGLVFAYYALIPAALNFFVSYGEGVVEQMWSIERYFEFVLLLLFSTGLAFQIPIVQLLLGALGLVTAKQMLSGWRYVIVGGAVLGAVLTPSTDPVTQSLLAGAVLALYFSGIGLVKLIGR